MRNKFKVAALLLVVPFVLMGCTGSSSDSDEPKKVDESTQSSVVAQETFKIGEDVQLGDSIVRVEVVQDPHTSDNQFSQPEAGNRYIAVEVVQSNASDAPISYNQLDWTLNDADGYSYDPSYSGSKDPGFSSGDLNAGKKTRGWITFEIPVDSVPATMQFSASWLSNSNVEIEL